MTKTELLAVASAHVKTTSDVSTVGAVRGDRYVVCRVYAAYLGIRALASVQRPRQPTARMPRSASHMRHGVPAGGWRPAVTVIGVPPMTLVVAPRTRTRSFPQR